MDRKPLVARSLAEQCRSNTQEKKRCTLRIVKAGRCPVHMQSLYGRSKSDLKPTVYPFGAGSAAMALYRENWEAMQSAMKSAR